MNTSDFTENRFLKLIDNIDQRGTSQSDGVPFSPFRPFSDLSMKERAAVIRIGVQNGLRDLESIRSKYNEYADGGHIYDGESEDTQQMDVTNSHFDNSYIKSVYKNAKQALDNEINRRIHNAGFVATHSPKDVLKSYAANIMDNIENGFIHSFNSISSFSKPTLSEIDYSDVYNTAPLQNTFLLPRSWQEEEMKKAGYIEGQKGDYGLVKKGVGNRNLPVYQTAPDAISRDKLKPIGNLSNLWLGDNNVRLVHPGSFPSTIYTDAEGNLYQKAWDLNDYGGPGGSTANLFGKLLDAIGNPAVQTTGFQPIYTSDTPFYGSGFHSINGMVPIIEDNKFKGWSLPEVEVIGNNKIADNNKFASGGSIHIKPENRGKFTALKKRTGHSASWFKAHGTPAQKKMAIFALNARKWKHEDGGYLLNMI